jgi:hypothetical protein
LNIRAKLNHSGQSLEVLIKKIPLLVWVSRVKHSFFFGKEDKHIKTEGGDGDLHFCVYKLFQRFQKYRM